MSDKYAVSNKLPAKQVSILAHRRKRILQQKSVVSQKRDQRIKRFQRKKRDFARAESFVMTKIKADRTKKRMKQVILRQNILKTESSDKSDLLVVMRHAGKRIADEMTQRVLRTLRMNRRNQTIFLRNNKENQILLKLVEPFVTYGYPTITTVRELIFKKAFAVIDGKKEAITSNTMIEDHLGPHGIICLEDIIHEIFTVGPNFDKVNSFLCPFLLKMPRDGWKNKVSVSFQKGGEYGNRKDEINPLIARCL